MLMAPETNLETGPKISYNHDQNFNKLERGIFTMVYIHKAKQYGAMRMPVLDGSVTSSVLGSLVLKMMAQDIPWWLAADLA